MVLASEVRGPCENNIYAMQLDIRQHEHILELWNSIASQSQFKKKSALKNKNM